MENTLASLINMKTKNTLAGMFFIATLVVLHLQLATLVNQYNRHLVGK